MGDTRKTLAQYAAQIGAAAKQKLGYMQIEYAELERKLATAKASLDLLSGVPQRALNFEPTLGRDFQCPKCWVESGRHSAIHPVPSLTRDDIFHCDTCHSDWVLEG